MELVEEDPVRSRPDSVETLGICCIGSNENIEGGTLKVYSDNSPETTLDGTLR